MTHVPSSAVLKEIVTALGAAHARGVLPNLERITIAGFSAGAQIVNRWALFSPMEPQLIQNDAKMLQGQHPNADATGTTVAQDSAAQSAKASVTVRAIVADGSSYVYLDQRRPDPKACNQGKDTGSNHTCTAFAVPGSSSVEACPMYVGTMLVYRRVGRARLHVVDFFVFDSTRGGRRGRGVAYRAYL